MPGWPDNAAPASSPVPVTRLSAPCGNPASSAMRANSITVRQASSAGFTTRGVAHGKGRTEAASDDLHRIVPGNDMGGHAVRLIQRDGRKSRPVRDGVAVNLVGGGTVEFEVARQRLDVGPRLLERLADVPRFELRQQIDILQDALADPMQDATAVGRRHASPIAGQRRPGCLRPRARRPRCRCGQCRQDANRPTDPGSRDDVHRRHRPSGRRCSCDKSVRISTRCAPEFDPAASRAGRFYQVRFHQIRFYVHQKCKPRPNAPSAASWIASLRVG